MKNPSVYFSRAALTAALLWATCATLPAGPPLICHPFEIGDAESLPWGGGSGWNTPRASYDVRMLVPDTLALLTAETPVLVRMETIRRATIYGAKDPTATYQLLSALMARALDAGNGTMAPAAWFDAGYLVESYRQAKWLRLHKAVLSAPEDPLEGLSGYAWVVKSIGMASGDPAMEFAAALMSNGPWPNGHFRKALAGVSDGSLLARTLLAHYGKGQAKSMTELRRRFGVPTE